jgi:2-amino-4-hydroxy-6-hydroxymethyldihydropteridine diphosphokinase
MTVRAGIALGSNLGNRLSHLQAAVRMLREIAAAGEALLIAPVYQTAPRLCPPGSPDFLNSVVEIGYTGEPLSLLRQTRAIENHLGRERGGGLNAPRTIDLDILYFGDLSLADPDLQLPHPRLAERRFVLQPLADIRPELILPGHRHTVAEILRDLPADEIPLVALSETLHLH